MSDEQAIIASEVFPTGHFGAQLVEVTWCRVLPGRAGRVRVHTRRVGERLL